MKWGSFTTVLLFFSFLFAQEGQKNAKDEREEELLIPPVTVTKTVESADESTSFVTTVKPDSVRMWQPYRLSEILSGVPGVWLSDCGSFGYQTFVSIRGTKPYHTVLLVDGVKVNDITLGSQFDLADIDPYVIGKVEVLRGAGSALFGSDSIGGVLLIETLTDVRKPTAFFVVDSGRYDTYGIRAGVSGAEGIATFSASAGTLHSTNAFKRYSFNRNSLASALRLSLPEASSLKFVLRFSERKNEFPFDYDYFTYRLLNDENILQRHTTVLGSLQYERSFTKKFSPQFSLRSSFCLNSSTFINGGDTDPTKPELEALNDALSLTLEPRLSLGFGETDRYKGFSLKTILGAEWQKISARNFSRYWNDWTSSLDSSYADRSVSFYATYLQTILGYKNFRLSAGGRYDDYSNYGSETSPRIGVVFDVLKERLVLRTSCGTGFRAPTPAEMYDPWVGNPSLGAEHSRSFDFGFVTYPLQKRIRFEVAYFNNHLTDMIAYNPATWKMENYKETLIEGFEFGLLYAIRKDLNLELAFTTQKPRDVETKERLPAVSPNFGSFALAYKFSDTLEFGMTANISESAPEENWRNTRGAERDDPGKKQVVDLFAKWEVQKFSFVMVKLENLLDDRYIIRETLPRSNGRSLNIQLSVRF
ncbi:MAG: TonB-dependent receptor [Planctomycetota bacterium]|nr:TonB-dependent receptor [Planctomycetota bacterium]